MLGTALSALVTGFGIFLIYLIVEGVRRVIKKWAAEEMNLDSSPEGSPSVQHKNPSPDTYQDLYSDQKQQNGQQQDAQ